jgi:hypothetical protein
MVNWKKTITGASTTSAEIFAGDVVNYLVQYHNDVDLAAGDSLGIAKIATETIYDNEKLKLADAGENNTLTFSLPEYLENKTVTFPVSMPTSDETVLRTTIQILTNKAIDGASNSITVNATSNTITDNSISLGDLMASNGTKFVRRPKGTALQVLRTNSGATDIEWASVDTERKGKAVASGNASNIVFTIAHGLGSNPTYAWINCSSLTETFTYTTDATNISVTFATPPPTGTSNVVIYWRVVA